MSKMLKILKIVLKIITFGLLNRENFKKNLKDLEDFVNKD